MELEIQIIEHIMELRRYEVSFQGVKRIRYFKSDILSRYIPNIDLLFYFIANMTVNYKD